MGLCDPIKFKPLWVLGASRKQLGNGENTDAIAGADAISNCPEGERNAAKSECHAATVEAVGREMVTGSLRGVNTHNTTLVPAGCSYSVADKRPIFNHAGTVGPGSSQIRSRQVRHGEAVPGYPWVCTYTVQRPLGIARAGENMSLPTFRGHRGQKDAAEAEIAAEITQWRRDP